MGERRRRRFARAAGFSPWFPGNGALDLVSGRDAAEGGLARAGSADDQERSTGMGWRVRGFFGGRSKTDLEIHHYLIESVMSGSRGSCLSGIGSGPWSEAERP